MKNTITLLLLISTHIMVWSQSSDEYTWRYYRPGNTGIQGDQANTVWIDDNGDPFIAASSGNWGEGGFAKFLQSENRWINYSNVDHPILGSFENGEVQILDIVKDFEGNLWMGNFTGALKFNPETGIASTQKFGASNSGLSGYTYDIDVAPDSSVWFTSGGLVRYDPKSGDWTTWEGSGIRLAVQPKADGSYMVWSADIYFGYVFTYNGATHQSEVYLPAAVGDVAGLPGKDCVDDAGNLWALRMSENGNWETLEYQKPDGNWVNAEHPYANVSFYIDAFKAFGNGKAVLVTQTGESWMFDGTTWYNYGTWRPGDFNLSVDVDASGNVWVCGLEGAAKRDVNTGNWQRYRITNTSQIDYFVEDLAVDDEGNIWLTGNAGAGYGGFQKFDGTRWTGFNEFTYGLGYSFPYQADNTQAICRRASNGDVVFNPTFNGIHVWDGANYYPIENLLTTSGGFVEDTQGRLWSLEEYGGLRYFNDIAGQWTNVPLTGWGLSIRQAPGLPGTIWAATDYEILRTNGTNDFRRTIDDIPGSAAVFTGLAVDENGVAWIGTWSQFTSNGSTLVRIDSNTGSYQIWSYDQGWPFPGEHVRPMAITPDGRLWLQFDSEYPSTEAGLCWFDGENVEVFPSSPGGVPQWGGLPNSSIKDLEVKLTPEGYELWMSCLGRGIAVLQVVSNPVNIAEQSRFESAISLSAFPNPANQKTEIGFQLENDGFVQLSIYDILGEKVKELVNNNLQSGQNTAMWDLTNQVGEKVETGIYFARLTTARDAKSVKIIVR